MKSRPKIIFILLFYTFVKISDSCHQCHSNYAACHDERSYSMCSAGIPNDVIQLCPEGYVCTSKTSICLKSTAAKPVQPTCQMKCGTCDSQGKLYSCLSNTTYALCFGADTPYLTAQGTCPDGYFCNLESGNICSKATDSSPSCNAIIEPTNPPTLPTTTDAPVTTLAPVTTTEEPVTTTDLPITTTKSPVTATEAPITTTENPIQTSDVPITTTKEPVTTTSVSVDPIQSTPTVVESSTAPSTQSTHTSTTKKSQYESSFCSGKEIGGSYKLESDPTCKRFVLCYVLAGQYLELHYICPGSQFYNEETRNCQREKPITCMQTWKKFNFF